MRILALTNLYPSPINPGRAPFNRQQFEALHRMHEVQVIAPIAWTDALRARRVSLPASSHAASGHSSPVTHHPLYYFTPKFLRRAYGRFMVQSIRDCFRRVVFDFRPDVVLASWAYPDGWAAVELAREARLPIVIKVHGSDVLCLGDRAGRKAPTADALCSASAVIAVSRHLAGQVMALGADPQRVHVVHNGVDRNLFRPADRLAARDQLGIPGRDPLLLFAGNLAQVKGLDILVEALRSLQQSRVAFQCAIVGSGPLHRRLRSWIGSSGLSERVRLVGACPLQSLPTWYSAADLLVLPSRSEGIPNVLLEAAACGTPFVATSVGGIPEIAPADWLVPPGEPEALAAKLRAKLDTPRRLGPSATDSAPLWTPGTWDDSARAIANVLQSVLPAQQTLNRRAA